MSIVTEYLKGIQKHFSARDKEQFSLVHGASPEDIEKLKAAYPLCPDSLIEFLNIVDGTYHRIYDKKITFVFLCWDLTLISILILYYPFKKY